MEVSHLRWVAIGPVRPSRGAQLFSRRLSEALEGWLPEEGVLEFTKEEFAVFGVDPESLRADTFVEARAKGEPILYYRPVVRTLEQHSDEEKRRAELLRSLPALLFCLVCLLLMIIVILASVMAAVQVAGC